MTNIKRCYNKNCLYNYDGTRCDSYDITIGEDGTCHDYTLTEVDEIKSSIKPIIKPLYTPTGVHIDDFVSCGSCDTFICYPTELDIEEEYRFCRKCGEKIDWSKE